MEKDFDTWTVEKERIQLREPHKVYSEGEVWWCSLGTNIGSEQDGTGVCQQRPVLILKRINKFTCYIVPLTTSQKIDPYRIPIGIINDKRNFANLSQIRLIDTKRLVAKVVSMDPCMFLYIRENTRKLF